MMREREKHYEKKTTEHIKSLKVLTHTNLLLFRNKKKSFMFSFFDLALISSQKRICFAF
jgi:hypothetical protein